MFNKRMKEVEKINNQDGINQIYSRLITPDCCGLFLHTDNAPKVNLDTWYNNENGVELLILNGL